MRGCAGARRTEGEGTWTSGFVDACRGQGKTLVWPAELDLDIKGVRALDGSRGLARVERQSCHTRHVMDTANGSCRHRSELDRGEKDVNNSTRLCQHFLTSVMRLMVDRAPVLVF